MRIERHTLLAALGLGIAVMLGLSTLMGGLFVWGFQTAIAIVLVALLVTLVKIWFHYRAASVSPAQISLSGFAYPKPAWLTGIDERCITDLTKAALVLLAFDRTESGCWGKTYLYRRKASGSGLPLARGSLAGTPLALIAIASCTIQDESTTQHWHYPLAETLANILTDDGHYLRGYDVGQVGRVPLFEPLRHAAGGWLINLLYGTMGRRDLKTLEALCTAPLDPMAYDKAMVSRVLVHTTYMRSIPHNLRHQAAARCRGILNDLIASANRSPKANQIWADPAEFGRDANNQWATVWAILPTIASPKLSHRLRHDLELILRQFLLAQAAAACSCNALLPGTIDKTGRGGGHHVFGTAMALVAWRTLELYGINTTEEREFAISQAKRLLGRLMNFLPSIILELPSVHPEGEPLALEGYFAWAGLCLVAASLGVRISSQDCHKVIGLLKDLNAITVSGLTNEQLQKSYLGVIHQKGLFESTTALAVARSISNVASLYRGVA